MNLIVEVVQDMKGILLELLVWFVVLAFTGAFLNGVTRAQ